MAKKNSSETSELQSLRVLMVEDSEDDAMLMILALKKGGYDPVYERVEDAGTMRKALREKTWDVILCDYQMPQFNGLAAIDLLKETGIDIPLIIVSGTIGEETAVECMRLGAHDYIMKGNLSRLSSAIKRELKEAESRRKRKRAEEALRESKEKYRNLFENANEAIFVVQDGKLVFLNPMTTMITGYSGEELTSKQFAEFIHPDDRDMVIDQHVRRMKGEEIPHLYSFRVVHKDGNIKWVEASAKVISWHGKAAALSFMNDITERKKAEEALRESEELFKSYLEYAPDGVYLSDLEGNFLYGNRKCEEIIGHRREELIGKNFLELNILPEQSLNKAAKLLQANIEGKPTGPEEIELINKEVGLIPVEINTSVVQRMGQKIVLAFVRDITERKKAETELKESKSLIEAVVENVPLMIFLKEATDLRFVIFNRAGEELLGYDRRDLIGKNNLDLFPPEQAAHFMAKDREVLDGEAGMLDIPEEPILTAKKGQRLLHTRKVCIRGSDGATKFLLGISDDITDRKKAEERLKETLESLRRAVNTTIQVMVSAVEKRDPYTAGHQLRVADIARAIATEMGLSQEKIDGIRMAGSIHDIGKLSIPAEILSKPGKLSAIEFSLIKEHSRNGYEMLKDVESPWPLAQIVYQHHERMDGSGYPRNLKGDEILMEARIMAVADVVESMASHRPYRPALGIDTALNEIEKNRGTHYDNAVADACLRLFREKGFKLEGA